MQKERLMAIFIGSMMLFSIIGFGLSNSRFNSTQDNTISFPFKVDRELTTEELVSILRSGRIVVEDTYAANCTDCEADNIFLETLFGR